MISTKTFLTLTGVLAVAGGAYFAFSAGPSQEARWEVTQATFVVPELTAEAQEGERYFNAVCAACHGQNGLGTEQGPPLVHDIYNPGHHADMAFMMAAQNGVPAHHWRFGNMPPQQVTRAEVARIVAYIRELQQANGITYRPHSM
ncbi:c-type cytochrome [Pararhodobacter marinus]|uniref:c-type cytochrome n=1 Tax=Pararhodobacter marinus TaxID=2184063 RepID=UPI003517E868